MIEMVRRQPQPFRTLWWAALVSVVPMAIGVAGQPGTQEGAGRLLFLPFPLLLAAVGGVLALDVNRNATTLVELTRREGSAAFGTTSARLLGAAVAVVALVLAVVFATGQA